MRIFKNSFEYMEIYEAVQQYKEEGKSWHYTSILLNAGEKTYVGSVADGDGNEIKIYKRENAIVKSVRQVMNDEGISEKDVYYKYGSRIFEAKDAQSSIRARVIDAKERYSINADILSIEYIPKTGRNKGILYEQFYKGDKCRLFAWLSDISETIDNVLYKKEKQGTYWDFTSHINNLTKEGDIVFPNGKKPVALIRRVSEMTTSNDDIILDFFAGSGTTAQAVMELNVEDGGNRQCICVQMPELLKETSEAYKAGYRTIADITCARIDNVIAKLKAEHPDKTADLACAHFTLAPSNFKVWRGDVADAAALRETLDMFQSAEKSGQVPKALDAQTAMLTELLLKHGLGALGVHAISKPVQLAGVTAHRVLMHDDKQLWLCFEPYTSALKDEIVKARPAQVVLLNSCFVGDKADELLSNLQLELAGLDISLTVI